MSSLTKYSDVMVIIAPASNQMTLLFYLLSDIETQRKLSTLAKIGNCKIYKKI